MSHEIKLTIESTLKKLQSPSLKQTNKWQGGILYSL